MSRRPVVLLSLSIVSLALAACSDTTAPTPSAQRQLKPTAAPSADLCAGGTALSSGKC